LPARLADHATDLNAFKATAVTTRNRIATSCVAAALLRAWLAGTPNMEVDWVSIAGSWNEQSLGCTSSDASEFATNAEMTFIRHSWLSVAH
jgi:hypothetical protein